MDELKSVYGKSAEKINGMKDIIMKVTKDFMPFIILLINIIFAIVVSLYSPSLQNPFTGQFFVKLLKNYLTTMVCYYFFVKSGWNNEALVCTTYKEITETWQKIGTIVRSKHIDRFVEYCREQVEKEITERRHYYILNYTLISVQRYEEEYKHLPADKIDQMVLNGELTKKEGKYIKKANAHHRIRPINPMLIVCGSELAHTNDVGRSGMSHSTMAILSRPVTMFAFAAVISMVNGDWHGVDKASVILDMISSVFMIILSSVMGYSSGASAFHKDHEVIKGRVYFMERFMKDIEEETEEKAI